MYFKFHLFLSKLSNDNIFHHLQSKRKIHKNLSKELPCVFSMKLEKGWKASSKLMSASHLKDLKGERWTYQLLLSVMKKRPVWGQWAAFQEFVVTKFIDIPATTPSKFKRVSQHRNECRSTQWSRVAEEVCRVNPQFFHLAPVADEFLQK